MNLTNQTVYEKHKQRRRVAISDDKYCAWLRSQRSAFSNNWPTEAAHFRTAENSGISQKPLFCAIPLTAKEHREQHRVGTFAFASRDWWLKQVARHQIRFIQQGGEIPAKYRVS